MTQRLSAIVYPLATILITLVASVIGLTTVARAELAVIAGDWAGTLKAGDQSLRLVLHVTADSSGKLGATLDSLDQGAIGLPATNVLLKGDSFGFEIPSVHGTYQATVDSQRKTLTGTWSQGAPLPLVFARSSTALVAPTPEATPTPVAARPPVALRDLKAVLDKELAPALEHGLLSKPIHGGMVIGVLEHDERRIFSYGTAQADSVFEIGSITKTFTGLILAQMVVQKKVSLNDPVRGLLPAGFAGKAADREITLLDLATQHSGLPRMPDNFTPADPSNPYADYDAPQLSEFLTKHGLARPADAKFLYSNIGFGLLGYALSLRAGKSYEQLLHDEVTGPLKMHDTAITLSPALQKRLIQGYDGSFDRAVPWNFDMFAGAGAIRSTASDMLTYLDANLHPDKYAAGATPGSPGAALPAAVALDHEPRAEVREGSKIALAWFVNPKTHTLDHNGGTGGYGSFARFSPDQDWAVVVLYNRDNDGIRFVDRVGLNLAALLAGEPSAPLDFISDADRRALGHPRFDDSSIQGSYHCRLTTFSLPASAKDAFNATSNGNMLVVADGKGGFTSGTWEHQIVGPNLNITCKLKMVGGNYSVRPDGAGSNRIKWELQKAESPRACFIFFSPAVLSRATDTPLITIDKAGKIFYSTALSPAALVSSVCEREGKD